MDLQENCLVDCAVSHDAIAPEYEEWGIPMSTHTMLDIAVTNMGHSSHKKESRDERPRAGPLRNTSNAAVQNGQSSPGSSLVQSLSSCMASANDNY